MKKRKREHLIPLEKTRKVIYLEKRGLKRGRMSQVSILFLVMGLLCAMYCLTIGLFLGYGTKFFLIWGIIGGCLVLLACLVSSRAFMSWIPNWVVTLFGILASIGLLIFIIVEGMIISGFVQTAPAEADYCIVLGAQLKKDGPSEVLRRRLDKAVTYLKNNPSTIAIVSGGQGIDEPKTEAQGMYEYLVAAGIEESRIIQEDQSTKTYENLINSAQFIDKENSKVVIVTNNFHMFRAMKIAQKAGYAQAYKLPADSHMGMMLNNMLREFFGVTKDFLVGNL